MMNSGGALIQATRQSSKIMARFVSTTQGRTTQDPTGQATGPHAAHLLRGSPDCSLRGGLRDVNTSEGRLTRYALYNYSKKDYQSMAEVPNMCPKHEVDNARSRLRISINLWIMSLASFGLLIAAIQFKRYRASGGMSWVERNRDQHRSWAQEYHAHDADAHTHGHGI